MIYLCWLFFKQRSIIKPNLIFSFKVMKLKLLIVALFCSVLGWGQVTIVSDGLNNSSTLFTLTGGAYFTGNSATGDRPASSPFASEGTHSRGVSNGTATLLSDNINTIGHTSINMSFKLASFSISSTGNGADAGDVVTVEVSPDGGATWYSTIRVLGNNNANWAYSATGNASTNYDGNVTPVDFAPAGGGARTTDGYSNVEISGLPSISNLRFRITLLNNAAAERWVVDDFVVQGIVSTPQPEINLQGNGHPIVCGSVTPDLLNHTDFGSVSTASGSIVRMFAIQNLGTATLNLTDTSPHVNVSGANASDFTVTAIPSNSVLAGNSTSFQITFNPSADGMRTAIVSIASNDADENPCTFAIQGIGISAPVITSSLTASGNQGSPFTYTITATNLPTSYNATGLPAGLSINTTTGVISGTPTVTGSFNITITATNGIGSDNEILVLTLAAGPCLSANFEGANPAGWTINGTVLGGQFCEGTSGLVFNNSGDNVITTAIANPQTLTFLKKRSGDATAWALKIQVSATGAAPWTDVSTISTITETCTLETIDLSAFSGGTYYIRFIDTRGSGTNQRTIDDVKVYCGPPVVAEINVLGNSVSITDGDTTPAVADDTDFGTTLVGVDVSHTFTITNAGPDALNISGVTITGVDAADFYVSIAPTSTVAAGGSTTFEVTFNPSSVGTSNATVNIANNDSDENPYTFDITGVATTCTPTTSVSSITPASGPAGTLVTINGSGFATATSVHFGVYPAAFTIVSGSVIQATVPANAITGNIIIQDAGGCDLSYSSFIVIVQDNSTCDPTAIGISDLFISEVTDASSGSLSYIQIFNATGATVDMSDYEVQIRNNGSGTGDDIPLTGTLVNGGTFVLATSAGTECVVPGGDGSYADQNDVSSGVNNNDCIHLAKFGTVIDTWGVCNGTNWINALGLGSAGYDFKRNPTATPLPSTTFVAADWTISDFNACSDNYDLINSYEGIRVPPSAISLGATYGAGCSSATVSVTGTEAVAGGAPLTYQWYYSAPGDIGWTMVSNGGVYSGATLATLTISDITGLVGYQYYCQVMEDTATCFIASEAVQIGGGASTTWDGTTWSNGVPNSGMLAIIDGDYDTALNGDFSCCSLIVNATNALNIRANDYVEIQYNLTNNGVLNVWNNGSLIQVNDSGVNTGNILYQRTAMARNLDYVYWSSPVAAFNVSNLPNSLRYIWNTTIANTNGGQGNWVAAGGNMVAGKGYIARASNGSATPIATTTSFVGVPNNGVINMPILRGSYQGADYAGTNGITITRFSDNWNLVGNPYPSSINVEDFLTLNTNIEGAVRIWTHGTLPSTSINNPFYGSYQANYTPDDYIAHNGVGTVSGPLGFNGFMAGGQGFLVNMLDGLAGSDNVVFNNSLRDKNYNNSQFYRTSNRENSSANDKNRIWLDLINNVNNGAKRTLIGYVENATYDKDRLYDAVTSVGTTMNLYSIIGTDKMTIQGRQLPFDSNDKVKLGYFVPTSGSYSIGIAAIDGLFTSGQNIYLEDIQLGVIHDLKQAPYSFTTNVGENNERFILRYTNETLSNEDFESDSNVLISSSDIITVHAINETIQSVQIHNVLGQLLVNEKNVSSETFEVSTLQKNKAPLIIQVTLDNGKKITKKLIY